MIEGKIDYSQVAELPFHKATPEQLSMMYTRYRFALPYVKDRGTLEIACGAGIGLGYLARTAAHVHGIDIDQHNLGYAVEHYRGNGKVSVSHADAHALPYEPGAFDAVVFFDSIYFMTDPLRVLGEIVRILPPGGIVLVSMVNREWTGFNPSHKAVRYFGGAELLRILEELGCDTEGFGAFPTRESSTVSLALARVRALAVKLRLIPNQVRAKELLKRLLFGKLREFGAEVTDTMGKSEPVVALSRAALATDSHKILYFAGRKRP